MLRHLDHHHCWEKVRSAKGKLRGKGGCVASGTKQLRIIKAKFDNDSIMGQYGNDYLAHSANWLRQVFGSDPSSYLQIDRALIMLLSITGPTYVLKAKLPDRPYVKRSGVGRM
jgi:hypothetical protein